MILYATLAKGPKLSREDQMNSTRLFMRELNRFGITSVVDAGGGFQNYPDDYEVVRALHERGELSSADVTGDVKLPEGREMVVPGDNVNLEVTLGTPIALEDGLRFAIREGGHTVGAGVVTKVLA